MSLGRDKLKFREILLVHNIRRSYQIDPKIYREVSNNTTVSVAWNFHIICQYNWEMDYKQMGFHEIGV